VVWVRDWGGTTHFSRTRTSKRPQRQGIQMFTNLKELVTGGDGFINSQLTELLVSTRVRGACLQLGAAVVQHSAAPTIGWNAPLGWSLAVRSLRRGAEALRVARGAFWKRPLTWRDDVRRFVGDRRPAAHSSKRKISTGNHLGEIAEAGAGGAASPIRSPRTQRI
jgi:hypothetical protein